MFSDLFYVAWRLAPLLFPFAYYWAVQSAVRVWDVIVTFEPGWSMTPPLSGATWEMAAAATASFLTWLLANMETDELHPVDLLLNSLCMIPAVCVTFVAGLLAFPLILAAANQPAVFIPLVGIVVACPWCWSLLQEAAQ